MPLQPTQETRLREKLLREFLRVTMNEKRNSLGFFLQGGDSEVALVGFVGIELSQIDSQVLIAN